MKMFLCDKLLAGHLVHCDAGLEAANQLKLKCLLKEKPYLGVCWLVLNGNSSIKV